MLVKNLLWRASLLCLLAWSVGANAALAANDSRIIATSALCTRHFGRLEREYGIPKHLMMAVGGVESGRWSNDVQMAVPWPWTINAEGKGQYFETMHEAVTAVRRLQAKGVRSIDVGCMQVNLKHHPRAFASVTQAFDPAYNTSYAAKFLRSNYEDTKSWSEAIAAYHSKGTQRGRDYFGRVKYNWKRVLAAVRGETLDALPYVARGGGGAKLAELTVEGAGKSHLKGERRSEENFPGKHRSPSMKIIKVTDRAAVASRRGTVLVIRPKKEAKAKGSDTPVQVASNAVPFPSDDQFVTGVGVRTPLSSSRQAAEGDGHASSRRKGPNFIFN